MSAASSVMMDKAAERGAAAYQQAKYADFANRMGIEHAPEFGDKAYDSAVEIGTIGSAHTPSYNPVDAFRAAQAAGFDPDTDPAGTMAYMREYQAGQIDLGAIPVNFLAEGLTMGQIAQFRHSGWGQDLADALPESVTASDYYGPAEAAGVKPPFTSWEEVAAL